MWLTHRRESVESPKLNISGLSLSFRKILYSVQIKALRLINNSMNKIRGGLYRDSCVWIWFFAYRPVENGIINEKILDE